MADQIGQALYPNINKQQYMERFEQIFSPRQMSYLRGAYALSKEGHRLQQRDDGQRYFDHVRACSWIAVSEFHLQDFELHLALILHDIVEDTYVLTAESIELFFGQEVAIMVNLLSHRDGLPVADYVQNLSDSDRPLVIFAKLIDRLHNLRTLGGCTPEKRQRKIVETRQFYVPLLEVLQQTIKPSYRWRAEKLRQEILALTDGS